MMTMQASDTPVTLVDLFEVRHDSDASVCSRQVVGTFPSFTLRERIEEV